MPQCDAHAYCHANCDSHCNSYSYSNSNDDAKINGHPKAASNACASAVIAWAARPAFPNFERIRKRLVLRPVLLS